MRIIQSFDENSRSRIQTFSTGETDDLAFNISTRVGNAQIMSVTFVLRMLPYSVGVDLNPGSRILSQKFSNDGVYYSDASGILLQLPGYFAIARIGDLPVSAVGGTYTLGYQVHLDDDRIVQDAAIIQCVLQGTQ